MYISNFNIDISGNHYQNLVQFDISSNDSLSIQNSITLLFTSQTIADRIFSLKLAPNKKIYCGRNNGSQYIGVINFPDSNSAVAQYQHNGIYLYGLSATWGLNNSMELSSYCGEEQSTEELTIPNIFTPNNDGINDVFEIKNLPKNANVQIYNRWGALIFESSSPNNFWNGKTKIGSELNEGVYFYIITLPGNERKTGFVQLIR